MMNEGTANQCPLCGGMETSLYSRDNYRAYSNCRNCSLVFVPERYHVSAEREKAEYDLHQNDPGDNGYRKFLSRLFTPLTADLPMGATGLDFGCGPGPTLSVMLEASGYHMDLYDKFYAPNTAVFQKKYDFITATEVLEHLHRPGFELARIHGLLKENGVLGVMTKLVLNEQAFEHWHYKNDMTHVCFFSRSTFEWLGRTWKSSVEIIGSDVILIHKGTSEPLFPIDGFAPPAMGSL